MSFQTHKTFVHLQKIFVHVCDAADIENTCLRAEGCTCMCRGTLAGQLEEEDLLNKVAIFVAL